MNENKILFAGQLGVGVTTSIKNISNIAATIKKETINHTEDDEITVEMDYGILKLDTGDEIHLYGIPDKEEAKPVHKTLTENCIGIILLINNTDDKPINYMLQKIEHYHDLIGEEAIAVGLTEYSNSPTPDINEYHIALRKINLHIPVFSINIHEKHDIIILIKALLFNQDCGVN